MKKISDYVRIGHTEIKPVIAEVINLNVMLVYNANEFNKKQFKWSHKYQIVDRDTKIAICWADTRKEVLEKFEQCKDQYYEIRETQMYKSLIKTTNQMIDLAKITKELEVPEIEDE